MTQEHKNEIYEKMFNWICEHTSNSYELFQALHKQIGMTKQELHEHGINSLDSFFSKESAQSILQQKIDANYAEYQERWLKMQPSDLILICGEVEAVTRMAEVLPAVVSENEAKYLIRFKNPLEVVSDEWLNRNGLETLVIDDEMPYVLSAIIDGEDSESIYEIDMEYYNQSDNSAIQEEKKKSPRSKNTFSL